MSLFLLAFISCREDELISEAPTTIIPIDQPEEFFTIELFGVVKDEIGQIISDANIVVGSESATTNQFGIFSIPSIDAPSTGLYVKVLKDGYFTGGSHFFPNVPQTGDVEITLIPKDQKSFAANEGYQGSLPGGATLLIPSSSVQRNGQDYSGTVNISSVWLDPEQDMTFNTMPGALIGQNQIGESQFLQTFGMIAVEMTDDLGQALQLKEGSLADLTFPLSPGLQGLAPASIPLWHFDETNGIWIEEGQAEQVNGQYEAQVSHFSWWNCDAPFDVTKICLDIVDQRGHPITNLNPCLSSSGFVNFCNGVNQYCGLVPTSTTFTLELKDACNEVVHSELIGPFNGTINDVNTQSIIIDHPEDESLFFTGRLTNCLGEPNREMGVVSIKLGGENFYDFSLEDGEYAINLIDCSALQNEVTITAIDLTTGESGEVEIDLINGQQEFEINLAACGSTNTEFLNIETSTGVEFTQNVEARQSVVETLISGTDLNNSTIAFIGFKGFGVGQFKGNVITTNDFFGGSGETGANNGIIDQATFVITRYEEVGGIIGGTFSDGTVTGSFSVIRQR